jgi:Animal haem peroxidase
MFPHLPVYQQRPESLVALGDAMIQALEDGQLDKALGEEDDDENTSQLDGELRLPAGYTYFGQFVDHDITFDPVSSLGRQNDPEALVDFRTPRFDLDSLYGRGPADQPYLYEADGMHLAFGKDVSTEPSVRGPDLQRAANDRALIGDPRNDENLVVSQLQIAFYKFHNAVVDKVVTDNPQLQPPDQFKLAQLTVRWHYQWVVIHDFLRRLVGEDVVADILEDVTYRAPGGDQTTHAAKLLFYHFRKQPFMPVEFSVAAYRYGHSMARPSYVINDFIPLPVVDNASRIPLFLRDGATETNNLNGFRPLPTNWGIQWKYFLPATKDPPGPNDAHLPQPSYKIDHELGHPLGALPASTAQPEQIFAGIDPAEAQVLAVRNLLRGRALELPSGQDVARAMGIAPLEDEQLFDGITLDDASRSDLAGHAPLWFYILREAELEASSAGLGPVGGRIVAEVLIGLLDADPLSYLSVFPTWQPTLEGRIAGSYTLTDIINLGLPDPPPAPPPSPYGG